MGFQLKKQNDGIFIYHYNGLTKTTEPVSVKIHISLIWHDYSRFQAKITDILDKYIENGTIDCFKFVNKGIGADIPSLKETPEEYSSGDETASSESSDDSYDSSSDTEVKEQQDSRAQAIEISFADERFLEGDQFTIYIEPNYNIKKIIKMCDEINKYLTDLGLQAGKQSDVADNISPHINLRLEYIYEGFKKIKIPAIPSPDDKNHVREQYKKRLHDEELFKVLHSHFQDQNKHSRQFSFGSLFKKKAKEPKYVFSEAHDAESNKKSLT